MWGRGLAFGVRGFRGWEFRVRGFEVGVWSFVFGVWGFRGTGFSRFGVFGVRGFVVFGHERALHRNRFSIDIIVFSIYYVYTFPLYTCDYAYNIIK